MPNTGFTHTRELCGCSKADPHWCQSHFPVRHPVLCNLLDHPSFGTGCLMPRAGTTGDMMLACPQEHPTLEALALCPSTEMCHPPGSVGIAITTSGSVCAHRGGASWEDAWLGQQQTPCGALLEERLNGNHFYLL